MKIWFDISNSPHVNMFHELILELKKEGHEIIITSRDLANTIELLNQKFLDHTTIGKHNGKNIIKKYIGYPIRIYLLYKFLRKLKPDISISQSSFHSPVVSLLLRIPCIYTNDNEHAFGNIAAYLFADRFLVPENMPWSRITKIGNIKNKMKIYPGIKEGIYLWSKYKNICNERTSEIKTKIHVYIRPEPRTAAYYKGGIDFMDNMIIGLQRKCEVTILPRDSYQVNHYSNKKFGNANVSRKTIDIEKIAKECSLFIGAGGSMTREIALLGVPSISVYQDALLGVDKYLIENKIMQYDPEITLDKIFSIINSHTENKNQNIMMEKGEKAYNMIKEEILKYK
jgi:predicted glycosyltransferase